MKKICFTVIAIMALVISIPSLASAQGQYVDKSIGVDVGFPNGSTTIPKVSFGIVGVTGGLVYSNNNYDVAW